MEIVALLNSGLTMSNGFDSAKAPERLMKAQAQELLQILQRDLAAYDSMLPSLPEGAVRVRTLTADPECTIQQLEQEIAKDAVIAARLVKEANSAALLRCQPLTPERQQLPTLELHT